MWIAEQYHPGQAFQFGDAFPKPIKKDEAAPIVLTYRTFVSDTANLTTYSFAGIDVGTDPNTLVIVTVHGTSGADILLSGTIGGSAAAIDIARGQAAGDRNAGIMSRLFTPGGTITIAPTFEGAQARCGIGVWTATNVLSGTVHATDFDDGADGSHSVNPEISAGGFGIYCATMGSSPSAITTTGADTEQYDNLVEAATQMAGADLSSVTTQSPTVTMNSVEVMVGATWR